MAAFGYSRRSRGQTHVCCRVSGCRGAHRYDHVRLERDQLRREAWQPLVFTLRMPGLDANVSALDVAEFAQALPERFDEDLGVGTGDRYQHTDPRGRLGLGVERPQNKTDSEHDREPDPAHSHLAEMADGKSSRPELWEAATHPVPLRACR